MQPVGGRYVISANAGLGSKSQTEQNSYFGTGEHTLFVLCMCETFEDLVKSNDAM